MAIRRVALPDPVSLVEMALARLIQAEQRAKPGLSRAAALHATIVGDSRGVAVLALVNLFQTYAASLAGIVPLGHEDAEARAALAFALDHEKFDLVGDALAIASGRHPLSSSPRRAVSLFVSVPFADPPAIAAWRGHLALNRVERHVEQMRSAAMTASVEAARQRDRHQVEAFERATAVAARAQTRAARKAGTSPDAALEPV